MKEDDASNCGRENDLIGFLYGELNEVEAQDFQRHLHACGPCSTELAGFAVVRESVVAWRNESLGTMGLPDSINTGATQARPSAIAALREFFNLSPLWMKGAVAFAGVLFCVLAGLAVARLLEKPRATVVAAPVGSTQSPEELKALVEQRVQDELKRIKSFPAQVETPLTANNTPQKNPVRRTVNRSSQTAINLSPSVRRPLSKTEREQLAADLRLVSAKSDSDVQLLDDTINR